MVRVGVRMGPQSSVVRSPATGYGARRYWTTVDEFTAITGIVPTAAYLCADAVSGVVPDLQGGASLAVRLAPEYQRSVGDMVGIEYPASGGHRADVNDPGMLSLWASAFVRVSSSFGGLPGNFGRCNAALTQCWAVYQQHSFLGASALIRDGLGSSLLLGSAFGYLVPDATYFAQVQIDRAANVFGSRWSPLAGGDVWSGSGSIVGFGTLTGAGQTFGLGSFAAPFTGNNAVSRCAVLIGAGAAGSSLMADMAVAMGVE